jgi:hypothetical protein
MSDDYGYSEKRKNKNDKRAKARFNRYKRGGQFRIRGVNLNKPHDSNGPGQSG